MLRRNCRAALEESTYHAANIFRALLPMKTTSRQTGWRLGGPNAPAWLQAPCAPDIKKGIRQDLTLLRDTFPFRSLAASHPLRQLWDRQDDANALAETRFEFHHLADDLRVIRGVPGSRRLLQAMISDAEGYADYRYELRMAGTVGRFPDQQLVRLGAKGKGADIEVTTKTGHLCGIACYRAQSLTPALRGSSSITSALAEEFGRLIVAKPIYAAIDLEIEFPFFPIAEAQQLAAVATFDQVWADFDNPKATRDGVTVSRVSGRPSSSPGNWEVRLKFLVPVPAGEKRRLIERIGNKLNKEEGQWATNYPGFRLFCVEESDWSLGAQQDEVKALLASSASHSFGMIVCTWPFFTDNGNRGRIRMEQTKWFAREGSGVGMSLGMQTFGENFESYCKGHIVSMHDPQFAEEEWTFRPGVLAGKVAGTRDRALSMQRTIARMPAPEGGRMPTAEELLPLIRRGIPGRHG